MCWGDPLGGIFRGDSFGNKAENGEAEKGGSPGGIPCGGPLGGSLGGISWGDPLE